MRPGVGGWDGEGRASFAHTVLVDMRERLRRSDRPDRVFEVALAAARAAGLLGRRRVLDCIPLCDAVATMDTVTLIRSAVRGLLAAADVAVQRHCAAGGDLAHLIVSFAVGCLVNASYGRPSFRHPASRFFQPTGTSTVATAISAAELRESA
jgi:hypothetical protein